MKGQFYSIMIALFIIPILALIVFYSQITTPSNIATNIRTDELQYFSESIEEDLSRFLQINGKRALVAAVNISASSGTGLDNASLRLAEAIENGTIYGNLIFADQKNLTGWEENISNIASESGFDINLSVLSFNVTQNDSFSVLFSTTVFINISDPTTGMGISKNMSVAEAVSIGGSQDPLYQIKTNGTVFRNIMKSPFDKIANPSTDLSNITTDIANGYYHSSTNGASFLDRLEGSVTLSPQYQPYGLESFVYLPDIVNPSTSSGDLDYEYWTNAHGYLLINTFQMPAYPWFRIGNLAGNDYGINSLLNMTT